MRSKALTTQNEWYASIPRSGRNATIGGLVILLVTFGGFGVWASTAPIAGAVIAQGSFVATGQNKVIQHLEGGVIDEILVAEGDIVEAGQTLIHLDETSAKANMRRLQLRKIRLQAMEARLLAEAKGQRELAFSDALVDMRDDPAVASILNAQRLAFDVRSKQLKSEIKILEDGKQALFERIEGASTQLSSVKEQIRYFEEEYKAKATLLSRGFIEKPELLSIKRALANLRGEIGRLEADIGDSQERVQRADSQIVQAKATMAQTAVSELQQVSAELDDVGEQILAAKNVLDRIDIVSPIRGIVVDLGYHTPGGVVESGAKIMEIVPLEGELLIEVTVQPRDIDNVREGQEAYVRLTALNQRTTPMLSGTVVYLSADALPIESRAASSPEIYNARIRLDPEETSTLHHFEPTPGMPAEVYIKSSERTFFDYLVEPIKDSMSRSFRET